MQDSLHKRTCPGAFALLACAVFLAGQAAMAATIPVPQSKPLITDVAQAVEQSALIPVPLIKPDFSKPAIDLLLSFGQGAPVPGKKPLRHTGAPLAGDDAMLYRKIFAYQATAQWDKADELMAQLGDLRLRGHILFQRYMHPTAYKADFDELSAWMSAYADHPGAEKIYKLALKRQPDGADHLRKPVKSDGINGYLDILSEHDKAYRAPEKRTKAQLAEVTRLEKEIGKDLARGNPSAAYKKLQNDPAAKILDTVEYDRQRAEIANRFMVDGKLDKAKDLALDSAKRSGSKAPLAGWVGGLVSWQENDYKRAAGLFELTANSPYASDWTAAAGAYWASRAHMRAGNSKAVSGWLRRAAEHPRTFYGLVATRALGWDFDFNWDMPAYTDAHKTTLMKYPEARRAMLLVKAGQYHLAERELRRLDPRQEPALAEALFAYASHVGLPSYAMRLAAAVKSPDGKLYDAALYPLLPWKPQSGFKVDRALIHALIRQESKFNPMAESGSGATGLMQLMPATASFISGQRKYRSGEGRHSLKDPQINLDIGQRYVENLLDQAPIDTELFSLMIAYNAGPGNLKKWKETYKSIQDDPLLFVETIPMSETRAFVERAMANFWIYRLRMNQPTPTLDAVAEGNWARYAAADESVHEVPESATPQTYIVADTADYR